MKCPYCECEMQLGYLYNGRNAIHWYPEDEKPGMFIWSQPSEHSVQIGSKLGFVTGSKAHAHYCITCKKVIIDVNTSNLK